MYSASRVSISLVIGMLASARFVIRQSTQRDTKPDAIVSDYRAVIIVSANHLAALFVLNV